MWRSRSTRSAWCFCLLGHLGRSGAGGAPATGSGRANWSRRGDIVGRFGGSLELIVRVLRRFVPDMQDLRPARTPARRGDVHPPRPCIPSRAALHRWRQRLPAVPASWSRPCAAPIAARYGKSAGIRPRAENCAPCAMLACSACRRCSATCRRSRRAEPWRGGQSRQGFRRTRGSFASAAVRRANNAGGYPPILLEVTGPERHPLPSFQYLQEVAQQVSGRRAGGDFRALLQAAADGGRSPGCSSKRMRMPRMLRTSPTAGAIRRRMPSCSSMRRSRCSVSSVLRRASSERPCAALPGRVRRRCDGPRWRLQRSRSQTQAPGGQGWRRGGEALMAPS